MREEIKTQKEYTSTNYKYTCSRCGEPCGDSEHTYYGRDCAKIEVRNKTTTEVLIAETPLQICKTEKQEIRIWTQEGNSYPEGSNISAKVIDVCTKCFEEVALPALLAAGFKVREEDRSW